jgi:hypothetical protein
MTFLLLVGDAFAKGYETDGGSGFGPIIVGGIFGLVFLIFFFSVLFGKGYTDRGNEEDQEAS